MLRRLAPTLAVLLVAGSATAAPRAPAPAAPPAGASAGPADPAAARLEALAEDLQRDARSPRGLVPLALLDALEDDAPDLARLAAIYARAADDRAAHPAVRALARFRLAAVERARGNLQKSASQLRRLGFVTAWKIVGPFEDEGKRGFGEAYPPEQGIDLAATMPGKEREVGWRDLPPDVAAQGLVDLGATVRPSREAVA